MKIKTQNATIATLMLVADMAARQRAFHSVISYALFVTDASDTGEYKRVMDDVNKLARTEMELVRALIFQYAEAHPDDLVNGIFEI